VRHLAGLGTIDPKRVCIVGGSYGGYAALAGVALDPGVYRCAVSVAGLSDLQRFTDWAQSTNGLDAFRYWNRFMGSETNRSETLAKISPIRHVDRISAPVLLIHGQDDTVVPVEQSMLMSDALKRAGKPVELVLQRGADHWLSQGDTRLNTLQWTLGFLAKHNPAD
jgi:dipeptidyl aminopeptidase/acylaminoacyl peptidase